MSWRKGFWKPKKNSEYAFFEVTALSTSNEAVGLFHKENSTTTPSWLKKDAHMEHEFAGTEKPKAVLRRSKSLWVLPDGSLSTSEAAGAVPATLTWEAQG